MSLADGDVVRFDYVLYVDDDKKPLETSLRDVAEKTGILEPEKPYQPLTVTVGGRQIIPGLEDRLRSEGAAGATFTADLAPEVAYGPRDPAKLRDVPMAQFRKQKVDPKVGMLLNFEGQRAVVRRVAGGRVRLDLNHDLAGHRLRYEITVREVITETPAKIQAIVDEMFHGGNHKVTVDDDKVVLELPDQAKFSQDWPMQKFRVLTQIRQAAGLDKAIQLVETYPAMPEAPAMDPGSGDEEE